MELKEFKSLIDLFFYQAEKQNPQNAFLEWLNPKNKKKFTWSETSSNIYKLAKILKKIIEKEVETHPSTSSIRGIATVSG